MERDETSERMVHRPIHPWITPEKITDDTGSSYLFASLGWDLPGTCVEAFLSHIPLLVFPCDFIPLVPLLF